MRLGKVQAARLQPGLHDLEHVDEGPRIIAGIPHDLERHLVRLELEVSRVPVVHKGVRDVGDGILEKIGELLDIRAAGGIGSRDGKTPIRRCLSGFLDGVQAVLENHVARLVGKDCSNGVLACRAAQEPAAHQDEPSGGREGVDLVTVDDEHMVAAEGVRPVGVDGKRPFQDVEIVGCPGIVIDLAGAEEVRRNGPPDVVFLLGSELGLLGRLDLLNSLAEGNHVADAQVHARATGKENAKERNGKKTCESLHCAPPVVFKPPFWRKAATWSSVGLYVSMRSTQV